jgi:hypothetical protein
MSVQQDHAPNCAMARTCIQANDYEDASGSTLLRVTGRHILLMAVGFCSGIGDVGPAALVGRPPLAAAAAARLSCVYTMPMALTTVQAGTCISGYESHRIPARQMGGRTGLPEQYVSACQKVWQVGGC